jgi:hypothetical protein
LRRLAFNTFHLLEGFVKCLCAVAESMEDAIEFLFVELV